MRHIIKKLIRLSPIIPFFIFQRCEKAFPDNWKWETLATTNQPTADHEAGLVALNDKTLSNWWTTH